MQKHKNAAEMLRCQSRDRVLSTFSDCRAGTRIGEGEGGIRNVNNEGVSSLCYETSMVKISEGIPGA